MKITPSATLFGNLLSFRNLVFLLFMTVATSFLSAQGTGYWHTSGSQILDSQNKPIRIAGINWYGFETTDQVAHGLTNANYKSILTDIAAQGYNTIRIPFSNQMVESPIVPSAISFNGRNGSINSDLTGLNSLQVLDKIMLAAGKLGLRVILCNHRSEAGNSNESNGLWYTSNYPETSWISDWKFLVNRYKTYKDPSGNPTLIGVDLRNEPHVIGTNGMSGSCWTGDTSTNGCPTSNTAQNWPAAATRAGNAVLTVNAALLIFVEGTDCYSGDCGWEGANLEGAAKYPVQLSVVNRLVYSAHDYGPDLFRQQWFNSQTNAASLASTWTKFWGYLSINGTAPVWIGEFGTTNNSSDVTNNQNGSQGQWFQSFIGFLANHPSVQWTYWALNGEDSFGLLDNNYDETPVNSIKQQMLSSIKFSLVGQTPVCKALPLAPTNLSAVSNSSSAIKLAWSAVIPPSNCSVSYNLFRGTTSGFTPALSNQIASTLTTTTYTDSGLPSATKFYYVAQASDSFGQSSSSNTASATTPTVSGGTGAACHIAYTIGNQWTGGFQAGITISNTGSTSLSNWTLQWTFPQNQQISSAWNANETQTGSVVKMTSFSYNGSIPPGGNVGGIGFVGTVGSINTAPTSFQLNGVTCK